MVQIIEEQPSFGQIMARGGGQAAGAFGSGFLEAKLQKATDKYKMKQFHEYMNPKGKTQSSPEDIKKRFLDTAAEIEQKSGRELTPQDLDELWGMMQTQQMGSALQGGQDSNDAMRQYEAGVGVGLGKEHLDLLKTKAEFGQREKEIGLKQAGKERIEEKKQAAASAKPTIDRGRELLEDLPYKENALLNMEDALSTGNLGMFSLDNLAEITGIEGLRSPEGARFKTDSKEFFLGNLSRVGSRGLNQMMEKVVLDMAPKIGRSTEANLAVTSILKAENDVTRKEAELINEIGQEYKNAHGHYPEDLAYRVYKQLRPYALERQKQAISEVDKIKAKYQKNNKEGLLMYDPSGNLRRVPHSNKKDALKEGYRMP